LNILVWATIISLVINLIFGIITKILYDQIKQNYKFIKNFIESFS
jgi:hypothetical protein